MVINGIKCEYSAYCVRGTVQRLLMLTYIITSTSKVDYIVHLIFKDKETEAQRSSYLPNETQ